MDNQPVGSSRFFCRCAERYGFEERRIGSVILLASKIIWCVGVVCWFVIRYPHARRSRRTNKARIVGRGLERLLLMISTTGLGILPALFVFSDILRFADYPIQFWQPWLGLLVFAFALMDVSQNACPARTQLVRHPRGQGRPFPDHRWSLRSRQAPDVHGLLALGAGAGDPASELDRRVCRHRRLWNALPIPRQPGRKDASGDIWGRISRLYEAHRRVIPRV